MDNSQYMCHFNNSITCLGLFGTFQLLSTFWLLKDGINFISNKLLFCKRTFYVQIPQFTFTKLSKMTVGMFLVFHTQTQLIIVQMHEYRHMHFITKLPYLTAIISILRNHRKYMWNWLSGLGCVDEIRYSLVANITISG